MPRLLLVTRLALADYRHEWLLSLCSIFAITAALVPLLVLLGVQFGIVGTLSSRLLNDPRNLEVIPEGTGSYNVTWFLQQKNAPEVAFIIPQTRALSASLDLYDAAGKKAVTVGFEPTRKGDPLIEKWLVTLHGTEQVVLSATAAKKLGVTHLGTTITGRVSRKMNNRLESVSITLVVQGILPLEAVQKDVVFGSLVLLEAIEDYRDGRHVPLFHASGREEPEPRTSYASFRMYARNLDSVGTLRDRLEKEGISVYTHAKEIASVKSLGHAFAVLSALLFSVVGVGFFASALSSALALVKRKQRLLGTLRVFGLSGFELAFFPLVQSGLTGIFGGSLAFILYACAAALINIFFRGHVLQEEAICHLPIMPAVIVFFMTCSLLAAGSLAAMRKVMHIDPAEVIRDV